MTTASTRSWRLWLVDLLVEMGTPADIADVVARHLLAAELAGRHSHGLALLPHYLDQIAAGNLLPAARPVVTSVRPAYRRIDGGRGFGQYTGIWTQRSLAIVAKETGLAGAHLVRHGHLGRLGDYAARAARAGFCLLMVNGSIGDPEDAIVAPYGGISRVLGTNPVAFGAPGATPVVIDMSTSAIAYHELARRVRAGTPIPDGATVGARREFVVSDDLEQAGVVLAGFGGHKGFAISLMAALLGGLATDVDQPVNGTFMLLLDPLTMSTDAVDRAVTALRSSGAAEPATQVHVPGEGAADPDVPEGEIGMDEITARELRRRGVPPPSSSVQ